MYTGIRSCAPIGWLSFQQPIGTFNADDINSATLLALLRLLFTNYWWKTFIYMAKYTMMLPRKGIRLTGQLHRKNYSSNSPGNHLRRPDDPILCRLACILLVSGLIIYKWIYHSETSLKQPRQRPWNPRHSSPTPVTWPSGHVTSCCIEFAYLRIYA